MSNNFELETIVYLSRASQKMTPVGLYGLVSRARECNRNQGLTGVLFYADGFFLHMLEGQSAQMLDMIARIEQDPRHKQMKVLFRGSVEKRDFPAWALGFPKTCHEFSKLLNLSADKSADKGRSVRRTIKQYCLARYPDL